MSSCVFLFILDWDGGMGTIDNKTQLWVWGMSLLEAEKQWDNSSGKEQAQVAGILGVGA